MLTELWDQYLHHFSDEKKDIYFKEAYVRAQALAGDVPICFVYNERGNYYICIFLKRRVAWLEYEIYDVETPYGYGGPITNTHDPEFILRASNCMVEELRAAGVLACFLRFHPLIGNQQLLIGHPLFEIIPERETAVIDLSLAEDELWHKHLHVKHRNAIRQARRAGLIFYIDREWKYLDDFRSLYEATMNRVEAENFYFFLKEYFVDLSRLSPQIFLGVVLKDKLCIAAAIYLCCGIYAHYHLSASDPSAQLWRPNNFMIYEAALTFKKVGVRWFHLGGASNNYSGNSLFQFKSRFTRLRRKFYIGKSILNRIQYDAVCAKWMAKYPEKLDRFGHFVLKYRF